MKPHSRVFKAVHSGKLVKATKCSRCGKSSVRLVGHHKDYDKPLCVEWLCRACHAAEHSVTIKASQPKKIAARELNLWLKEVDLLCGQMRVKINAELL